MSVLNKVESGYLQLMRILVLALATIVLVGVVVLGVSAVSDYNAKPATVSEAIDIKASSFKLDDDAAEGTGDDAAKQHPGAAKLEAALADVINKHGKTLLGASFQFDKAEVHELVVGALEDPDQGEPFLTSQTAYLDQVLGRADVAKQAKTSEAFYAIVNKVFVDYHMAYITEKDRISTAKDAAKLEASDKRSNVYISVYMIAALFSAFIMLVLLIVQIRIERSIRVMSEAHARA
jgi:hypothetical protein